MAPTKRPHSGGKPAINITEEMRRQVLAMAGFGLKQDEIASVIGVSEKTLQRRCKEELHKGVHVANSQVLSSLFYQATKGGNVTAAIFWAKARCGWRETQLFEVKSPLPLKVVLSDDEGAHGASGDDKAAPIPKPGNPVQHD